MLRQRSEEAATPQADGAFRSPRAASVRERTKLWPTRRAPPARPSLVLQEPSLLRRQSEVRRSDISTPQHPLLEVPRLPRAGRYLSADGPPIPSAAHRSSP